MINVISREKQNKFIPVDSWNPKEEDFIVNHCKGSIIIPVSQNYNIDSAAFDRFDVSIKRGYDSKKSRDHYVHYINYFEKFYDPDKELITIYGKIKFMIDIVEEYDFEAFMGDLERYIFRNPSLMSKINWMNEDNYTLNLDYDNKKHPNLQYNDNHGKALLKTSLIINILIPLITHFAYIKNIEKPINEYLLTIYSKVLDLFDVDLYNKLYETCITNIIGNKTVNPIWNNQDIRCINTTTHALYSVHAIIICIIPKYKYNENIIYLNFISIKNNIIYKVTDIEYEYDYMQISSHKRDEDQNSEFDKFEATLSKQDESLYIQNQVNCEQTMKFLENKYKISQDEVDFYIKELSKDSTNIINHFQKDLIFNLFYKDFGDVVSIRGINKEMYIKLMIMAKIILKSNNLVVLPYIISGRVVRLSTRNNLNKKELDKVKSSPYFKMIMDIYKNEKIKHYIISLLATIISSQFEIIDYYDKSINGVMISNNMVDAIFEELLMYISLIM